MGYGRRQSISTTRRLKLFELFLGPLTTLTPKRLVADLTGRGSNQQPFRT